MIGLLVLPLLLSAQAAAASLAPQSVTLESGSPLWIQSDARVPLRLGQSVPAHLQYAVFAENRMVLPIGAKVQGTVVAITPDKSHRLQARLRGDFTPFGRPVVQFSRVQVNGVWRDLPLSEGTAGAAVMQLTPPAASKGGLLRREWDQGLGMVKDRLRVITAPGKGDRLKQLLYSQLPYHPQAIDADTVWTVDTTAATNLAAFETPAQPGPDPQTAADQTARDALPPATTWTLQAFLAETTSSKTARAGMAIRAIVAEPVINARGAVEVPQGSVLEGHVTRARPARSFGRAGQLRFDFRELELPGQSGVQEVQTSLAGIDAAGGANLALDREGQVQPKPKDKVVIPFLLLTLAARPLDRDRGDNAFGKDAVASNSLGVVGFLIGTAGGWRNVAAGIGYYGSAVAIWNRWIKKGEETTFRRDTRVVLQTTARASRPLVPESRGGRLSSPQAKP